MLRWSGERFNSEEELKQLFDAPIDKIWLEIGFGGGEHLIWQAEHHPDVGVIGIDPFVNGVSSAISLAESKGLAPRVRLHNDDALPFLSALPPASIDRVFMLFPDPWPKARHRQRRLFSSNFADRISVLLRDRGQFRFASDIIDYAEAALAIGSGRANFEVHKVFTSADRDAITDWPATRYERKAVTAGRSSLFFILTKKS